MVDGKVWGRSVGIEGLGKGREFARKISKMGPGGRLKDAEVYSEGRVAKGNDEKKGLEKSMEV